MRRRSGERGRQLLMLLAGLALLIVGFDVLPDLAEWTLRWGVVPVYLVYFLLMSVAARLFWSGADPLFAAARDAVTRRPGHDAEATDAESS